MGSNVIDKSISQLGETNKTQVDHERRRRDVRDTIEKIDLKNPPPAEVRDQYDLLPMKGWTPKGDAVMKDFSKGYKRGGKVRGRGRRDSVKARLTPGEFVVKKSAVKRNAGTLQRMNRGAAIRNVRSF